MAFGLALSMGAPLARAEGCDVGGGGNDIKSIAASFDADFDLVEVRLELCDAPEANVRYSVHFDFCTDGSGVRPCSEIGLDTADNAK